MNAVTQRHGNTIVITLPIRARNPLNGGQAGWRAKARVRKEQRGAVALALRSRVADVALPVSILVTRIAPRSLDAWDGLGASLKGVIDGIADALGTDDGNKGISWAIDQRRGRPGEYAVEIAITRGPNG